MNFKDWLVESTILLEINEKIASQMDDLYGNADDYAFKNMFKKAVPEDEEATRFVVPFENDPIGLSILNKIKSEGYEIFFDKGLIQKDKRQIRLGKYILDKRSPFTEEEKKWWMTRGDAINSLKDVSNIDQYAIIISRNPFDVVRMGDFDTILNQKGGVSCHSPRGSFFSNALADAAHSGGIAYVVKRNDLSKVNLKDKEIFKDDCRDVDGIVPISRLRLRKFENKKDEEQDLAVPEIRLYGKPIPGFAESLRKAVLDLQKDHIESAKDNRPRLKDYVLCGGSYQDTDGDKLFNTFFGDELDEGAADLKDKDAESTSDQWDRECDEITTRISRQLTHASVSADVDVTENMPYVIASAYISFKIRDNLFTPEFLEMFDNTEKFRGDLYDVYRNISSHLSGDTTVGAFEIKEPVTHQTPYMIFEFYINAEEVNNPDDYRSFAENIKSDLDDKYEEISMNLLFYLSSTEFTRRSDKKKFYVIKKSPQYLPKEIDPFNFEYDPELQTRFKNFTFDFHDVASEYDAYLGLRHLEPVYDFELDKQMPFIKKFAKTAVELVEKYPWNRYPAVSKDEKAMERYMLEKYKYLTEIVSGHIHTGLSSIKSQMATYVITTYDSYLEREKMQKNLFQEPEFQPKILLQKHPEDKSKTHDVKNFIKKLFDEDLKIKFKTYDYLSYDDKEKVDASRHEGIVFFMMQIIFDSNKHSEIEQEYFLDFAHFLDQNYGSFIKIVQKIIHDYIHTLYVKKTNELTSRIEHMLEKFEKDPDHISQGNAFFNMLTEN